MGYACPVCDDPQADAAHLANHLAFTAMTGGQDHEAWLDETVGEWSGLGETELGEIVTEHAEERAFPQVFEESGTEDHDQSMPAGADRQSDRELSEADAAVLEEARELTKEMLDGEPNADTESDADTDAEPDADEPRDETE